MFAKTNVVIVLLIASCLGDDLEQLAKVEPQLAKAFNDDNAFRYIICKTCIDTKLAEKLSQVIKCSIEAFPSVEQLKKAHEDNVGQPDKCVQQAKAIIMAIAKPDIPGAKKTVQKCYTDAGIPNLDYKTC